MTKEGSGMPLSRTQVFANYSKLNICDWTYLVAAYGTTTFATVVVDNTIGVAERYNSHVRRHFRDEHRFGG